MAKAGDLPGRSRLRDLAAPAGREPDPEPPLAPEGGARAHGPKRGRARPRLREKRDAGDGRGLRARHPPAARRGPPDLRAPRRRRLQARGNRDPARDLHRNIQGPAPPGAHDAAPEPGPLRRYAMSDRWTDRLSQYMDGELDPAEAQACEAHVDECAECAATLAELRQVVERARTLESEAPAAEVWDEVAERIRATEQETADTP